MLRIFTIDSEYKSAHRLGFPTHTYFCGPVETFDNDIIVRWGNSALLCNKKGEKQEFKNVINLSSSIRNNCNKPVALKNMAEVVRTPCLFNGTVPKNKLAVVRSTEHTGGIGFEVLKGPFKLNEDQYATQFIRTIKEYRVWFIGNSANLSALRVTENKEKLKQKYKCRSQYAYKFYKTKKELKEQVLKAANKLKLEFGAADILFYRNKYYFLECNTAASCDSKKIIEFYKEGIVKLAKKKFPTLTI